MIRPVMIAATFTSLVAGCATGQITSNQTYRTTTILGTWCWNVESNRLGDRSDSDFWWEQVTNTNGYLVPLNGTKAGVVRGQAFDRIDSEYVGQVALSQEKIAGDSLRPGAIVVFRTAQGKTGKLQVVGYKASHDFDFPEAVHLNKMWKRFALSKPNIRDYNLQVRWRLLD